MEGLVRYEKLELLILGIIVPGCILVVTIFMLTQGKSFFIGRGDVAAYFYGTQSYLVSMLWFGISPGLISRFLLRYTVFNKHRNLLFLFYSVSLLLIMAGLISSIWFTFSAS